MQRLLRLFKSILISVQWKTMSPSYLSLLFLTASLFTLDHLWTCSSRTKEKKTVFLPNISVLLKVKFDRWEKKRKEKFPTLKSLYWVGGKKRQKCEQISQHLFLIRRNCTALKKRIMFKRISRVQIFFKSRYQCRRVKLSDFHRRTQIKKKTMLTSLFDQNSTRSIHMRDTRSWLRRIKTVFSCKDQKKCLL